ncbi:MAG: hypothetical protein ABSB41_18240 [Anaerolineales bacterium]|jgi:hypothetical protein
MDNSVDPQVIQTWRQARLRAFLSLLEITRTDITNKTQWEEERDNAFGLLEWALTSGLEEVKHTDCPDFIELVTEMASRIIEDSKTDENSFVQIKLANEAVRKSMLEFKKHYPAEIHKRLQAIQDADKELHEVILPAKKQLELKVRNGTVTIQEFNSEHLRITTRLDEIDSIFKINKEQLEELKTGLDDQNKNIQESFNTNFENGEHAMKNLGNSLLRDDRLRRLLAEFAKDSLSWLESASEETTDVSEFSHFIVRAFMKVARIWIRVVLFFKK